jgi:LEA14-like dessication related protein
MYYSHSRRKVLIHSTMRESVFLSRRRIILIGVIAAVAITIILLPLILTVTLPSNLNSVSITLSKVEVINMTGSNLVNLNLFFNIHNPTGTTLTTSGIDYDLFANGTRLGPGSLSYADVPVNGRPQLFSNTAITLQSPFQFVNSHPNSQIFKFVQNPATLKHMKWKADGVLSLESGFSSASKQFNATL